MTKFNPGLSVTTLEESGLANAGSPKPVRFTFETPTSTLPSGEWGTLGATETGAPVRVVTNTGVNGATFEGRLYRAAPNGLDPLDIGDWNINANHRYTGPGQGGLYFSTGEHVVKA